MHEITDTEERECLRAGYSEKTAQEIGSENLSKPIIQKAIQEAQTKQDKTKQTKQNKANAIIELAMIETETKQKISSVKKKPNQDN